MARSHGGACEVQAVQAKSTDLKSQAVFGLRHRRHDRARTFNGRHGRQKRAGCATATVGLLRFVTAFSWCWSYQLSGNAMSHIRWRRSPVSMSSGGRHRDHPDGQITNRTPRWSNRPMPPARRWPARKSASPCGFRAFRTSGQVQVSAGSDYRAAARDRTVVLEMTPRVRDDGARLPALSADIYCRDLRRIVRKTSQLLKMATTRLAGAAPATAQMTSSASRHFTASGQPRNAESLQAASPKKLNMTVRMLEPMALALAMITVPILSTPDNAPTYRLNLRNSSRAFGPLGLRLHPPLVMKHHRLV